MKSLNLMNVSIIWLVFILLPNYATWAEETSENQNFDRKFLKNVSPEVTKMTNEKAVHELDRRQTNSSKIPCECYKKRMQKTVTDINNFDVYFVLPKFCMGLTEMDNDKFNYQENIFKVLKEFSH
ncbi:hypothetical protein CHUAL_003966 [Chamberlinius hualienensis]